MKKIIIFSVIVAALFFTFTPSVQAKQQFFKLPIPAWFSQAIEPIQNTIKSLTGKIDNHEARIAELEKKIVSLEEKVAQHTNTQTTNNGQLSIEGGNGNSSLYPVNTQTPLNIGNQTSGNVQLNITNPPNTTDRIIDTQFQQPIPTIQPQTQTCEAVMLNGEPLPSGQLIPSDQITVVCK